MSAICLVIQTFVKLDTLQECWDSILKCNDKNKLNIIVWQDSPVGSRKESDYSAKAAAVEAFINENMLSEEDRFQSIEYRRNSKNLGPCETCMIAINHAAARFEKVIFTEDDTIFSRDAIQWFEAALELDEFRSPDIWAVSGESIYFDARMKPVEFGFLEMARDFITKERLIDCYQTLNFVPSTCFATTAAKWKEFGETRGQKLGDVDVCNRCAKEKKFCIFPVVPRVKDVGMLNPDGYSVLIHTAEKVTAVKSTYLMADEFPCVGELRSLRRLDKSREGELWRRTALLEGFGELPPWQSNASTK